MISVDGGDRLQLRTVRAGPVDGQLSLASIITLFGNEKEIARGIGYAQFLAYMRGIAGCGHLPSFGIEALSGGDPCEHAADSMPKAALYFEQVIGKDPSYTGAYSGLADRNSGLAWHGSTLSRNLFGCLALA